MNYKVPSGTIHTRSERDPRVTICHKFVNFEQSAPTEAAPTCKRCIARAAKDQA